MLKIELDEQKLIKRTFESQFSIDNFANFVKRLFNDIDIAPREIIVPNSLSNHIKSVHYLAEYKDSENKTLDVLTVELIGNTKITRARTLQRNLIAKYLKDTGIDAALVAFYSQDYPDWRLSFIKMEYKLTDKGPKAEVGTPPKRYSFLVGPTEPSHTAGSQLKPLLEDQELLLIFKIEDAFKIEKVTKEFFTKYKQLFEKLEKELANNKSFINEAARNNLDTGHFAKRLLGQIVFLYFLQKKGWLGVPRGGTWGDGDKHFLRSIFTECINEKKNFFNDYLEHLFYDTLNNPRNDQADRNYSKRFDSKIPFLNGGLFEPEYDWQNSLIYLDNMVFADILDEFDLYNFTVKEDEPLDKEVAVDPEMLGKVFENLLEENLRKGKGTYYTPREIVHYMCQESLANYLATSSKIDVEDIRILIQHADIDDENLPAKINKNASMLDSTLSNIKVVDPACGSGAFCVGMLQEIVKARLLLNNALSEYQIKKDTIQNCIYGVDIDPGAIDIAKLRLWLSLVVDYELEDIEPLPNLDYKIMQGNSLLEDLVIGDSVIPFQFNGQKKIDKRTKEMKNLFEEQTQGKLFFDKSETLADKLEKLHFEYFTISDPDKKKILKKNIDSIENELINSKCEEEIERAELIIKSNANDNKKILKATEQKFAIIEVLNKWNQSKLRPFFPWKLHFGDVFKESEGFDVIIANPPYIKEYINKSAFDGLRKSPYYKGKMDIWYFFACLALDLLKPRTGILTLIAQNNWVTSYGASNMRNKIVAEAQILSLIDFGDFKIFEAGIQTMVMLFEKNNSVQKYTFDYRRLDGHNLQYDDVIDILNKQKNSKAQYFIPTIERERLKDKMLTFSDSEIEPILEKISGRSNFILNPNTEVAQGIVCPQDYVNKASQEILDTNYKVGEGIFILNNQEKNRIAFTNAELKLIKPSYGTKQLHKWYGNRKNEEWIIYTGSSFNNKKEIENYPNIKEHLDKFKKVITSDNKPYGLHRARDEYFFKGEKIIALRKCAQPTFTYTDFDSYVSATFYVIKTERLDQKYLVALLNTELISFWFKHKGKMQGNNFQIDKEPIINLPIYEPLEAEQKPVILLVNQIIESKKKNIDADVNEIEKQINQLVYKLYKLSPEEIKIIEGK